MILYFCNSVWLCKARNDTFPLKHLMRSFAVFVYLISVLILFLFFIFILRKCSKVY